MENPRPNAIFFESKGGSLGFPMENPFSLKVGQVFTGFGIGCGVGIGVGRPIYLGAIPMLQQVMSTTSGATDAFSGVGRHVNSSIRKLGVSNIEAGVGCGVGLGHGFGVGIALKPGVVNRLQSSALEAIAKLMAKVGLAHGSSSVQNFVPRSFQSSINAMTSTCSANAQPSIGNLVDVAPEPSGSSFDISRRNEILHRDQAVTPNERKGITDRPLGSRTEKVLDSFLQNPIFKHEEDVEVNTLAENLRSENNVLHVLLKHQQAIQELLEENQKLHRILVEDLKVSPNKLHNGSESSIRSKDLCADCFECRRRKRKTGR